MLGGHPRLVAYDVHALAEGPDAEGKVTVQIAPPPSAEGARGDGRFTGEVTSTNIVAASVEAYVEAINAMLGAESWAGAAEEAGSRRPGAGAAATGQAPAEFDDEAEPDRHDRVVQPLNGPRVAYPGEPGAFAEDAVLRFFAAPEAVALSSFRAVFEAVRDGEADAGVVPVESSLLGTIRENLDLLWAFELPIVGEVSVPVRLALLGAAGRDARRPSSACTRSPPRSPRRTSSCGSRPWSVQTTYNTAGAAKQVAERGERGSAAVASARVAAIYGLEVLADDIQSGTDNRTRFAVIARAGAGGAASSPAARREAVDGPPRTTLVFAVRNVPGLAPPLARRVRLARAQPVAARVAPVDRARVALGVPVLGRPRRRPGRSRVRRGARRARDRDRGRPDPGHLRAGPPRSRRPTRACPGGARARVRSWAARPA